MARGIARTETLICTRSTVMVEDLERPGRKKKAVVKQKATSCDLCTHLKEPSCVYACPHDAAHRVDPRTFFFGDAWRGNGEVEWHKDFSLAELTRTQTRMGDRVADYGPRCSRVFTWRMQCNAPEGARAAGAHWD